MTSFRSRDDVLTLLVHLGYLAFDLEKSEVFIPNQELIDEFKNSVEDGGWEEIASALNESEKLLDATIQGDESFVAENIDRIHMKNVSVLEYNNENALSCVITLAYYSARKDYILMRELPAGKGFADIAFLPRKGKNKPPIVVELKWAQAADGAIRQIKEKRY